jgi:O-antigen/teichoic acid export membrane protein
VSTQGPADLVDSAAAGPAAMRGGVLRAASFAASLLVAVASAPLLVRHLGAVEFGRYATALAIVAISVGLTEGGVSAVALRELAVVKDAAVRRRLMSDLLGMRVALTSAGVAAGVAFTVAAGYGHDLSLGVLLAGIGTLFALVQTLLAVIVQSQLRFGWAALIEFARGLVALGLIVALVLAGKGIVALLAVSIPAGLASIALTVPLVRKQVSLRPAFALGRWRPLLRDVLVIAMAVAVYALYFRVTLLVTSQVSDARQTGYFAISFRIMEALIAAPVLLVGAAFPIFTRAAREDRARFDYASRRTFELAALLGGLAAMALALLAPLAIALLVGTTHHPSVRVLQIQSVALLPAFVIAAVSFPLLAMHRQRVLLGANLGSLCVALALAVVLASSHGAQGAAIAAVAADATLATLLTVMLVRRDGPPLPLSALAVTLVAGGGGYAAGRLVGAGAILQTVVGCLVFVGVLFLLRRFPPELRELLTSRRAARPA